MTTAYVISRRLVPLFIALALLSGSLAGLPAAAGAATIIMKMGTATVNDQQHEWLKRF